MLRDTLPSIWQAPGAWLGVYAGLRLSTLGLRLGNAGACLLRQHGATVTGEPIEESDAALLRLGEALDAASRRERELYHVLGNTPNTDADALAAAEAAADRQADETGVIVDAIAALPARTPAGLTVKVRALLWCRGIADAPLVDDDGASTTEAALMRSLSWDVRELREAGSRPA